ncbi:transposase [Streptomyces sp. NPDC001107]
MQRSGNPAADSPQRDRTAGTARGSGRPASDVVRTTRPQAVRCWGPPTRARGSEVGDDVGQDYPGAEIICRDRASAYTKAVKKAAPHALEVADRWHLPQNLSAAVEKTCHQHRDCLRKRAEEEPVTEVPEPPPMLLPPPELPRTQIIERTRHRYEDIHRLLEERWTISAIARRLNLDRKTVRRFRDTDLDELPVSARERPSGVLEPFKAYLNAPFTEAQGQVSGTQLFQEIQARGYRGSRQVVRKLLAALREGTAEPVRAHIPSPRKITSWIMRPLETLTNSQDERLLQVRLACRDITRACDLARAFADLVRHQRGYLLLERVRQAEQDAPKPMKGFAGFLRQDLGAVTAGLTLQWSSGAVERHVNRVKTLKRAMYRRASFELLRTRILTQSRSASISQRHCPHCQRSAPSRPLGSIVRRSSCRPDSARPVGEPSSPDSMTTQPASTPDTFTSPPASSSSSVANTAS